MSFIKQVIERISAIELTAKLHNNNGTGETCYPHLINEWTSMAHMLAQAARTMLDTSQAQTTTPETLDDSSHGNSGMTI